MILYFALLFIYLIIVEYKLCFFCLQKVMFWYFFNRVLPFRFSCPGEFNECTEKDVGF